MSTPSCTAGALSQAPLPLDPSAWYFGSSVVLLAFALAVTLYAFRVSLGARPTLVPAEQT